MKKYYKMIYYDVLVAAAYFDQKVCPEILVKMYPVIMTHNT